jgi:hypothetical protein
LYLRNNILIEFLSGNLLVFLSRYQTVPQSDQSEKELLITTKKKYGNNCKASLIDLFLKIKKGIVQEATFIHSDPGYAKMDNFDKMKLKQREAEM